MTWVALLSKRLGLCHPELGDSLSCSEKKERAETRGQTIKQKIEEIRINKGISCRGTILYAG
jgi:hypothetical protein